MSAELGEDSTVSFTVKELLNEQTSLLRGIDKKVDGKADKADLVPIVAELRQHNTRITTIEDDRKAEAAAATLRTSFWKRSWAVVAVIVVPVSTALVIAFVHP